MNGKRTSIVVAACCLSLAIGACGPPDEPSQDTGGGSGTPTDAGSDAGPPSDDVSGDSTADDGGGASDTTVEDGGDDSGPPPSDGGGEDSGPPPDDGGTDGGGDGDGREAAVTMLETLCEATYECPKSTRTREIRLPRGFESVEACKSAVRANPERFMSASEQGAALFARPFMSNRTDPDLEALEQCTTTVKTIFCDHGADTDEFFPACNQAYGPLQEEGDLCLTELECTGDLTCEYGDSSQTCAGTCVQPSGDTNTVCDGTECGDGEYCETESMSCEAKKGAGSSCQDSNACQAGLGCTSSFGSDTPGTCREYGSVAEGNDCGSLSSLCETDLTCDEGTCKSVELAQSGGGCGGDVQTVCEPKLICSPGPQVDAATCKTPGAAGDECGTEGSPRCREGLFCTQTESCEELRSVGEECSADRQCATQNCDGGSCREFDPCSI